ncbi:MULTISPECIES: hypothetical protein [unclassified Streptomyces]|uniref:hypothetical protein n=1 Tax=unclassified Streptomyces TaxID=2593676 RepID=UPI0037FF949A
MTTGVPDGQDPSSAGSLPRNVTALLVRLNQEKYSGTVLVSGAPGGTIHLRDGLICAIETPGTPSVESALLKSGRVDDEGWACALGAVRHVDGLGGALVGQELIGEVELEVLCTATIFEGAFAMALSRPDGWDVTGPASTVLTRNGIEPQTVADETSRRLALVTRQWGSPGELARAKMRPSGRADRVAGQLTHRYQAILAVANARRTPRDLAFTLGRGLFGVMADLIRMNDLQLIQWEGRGPAGRPSTAPRLTGVGQPVPAPLPAASLPRRVPGARGERRPHGGPQLPGAPESVGQQDG